MRLQESDPRLTELCRELETRAVAGAAPEAADQNVPVTVLTDFSTLDVSKLHPIKQRLFREGPAMYRSEDRTVLVNASAFFCLEPGEQLAVLAHEVAHALRHRLGINGGGADEHETDLLACRLGCAEELIAHRALASRGRAEALKLWRNPSEALAALQHWFAMKVAGLAE